MKILVPGCNGQLGRDMMLRLRRETWDAVGVDLPALDITDAASVQSVMDSERPDIILNCSAYTAVDAAESDPDRAFAVNARAVADLGRIAGKAGASVVHISTDYVFDGTQQQPYTETDTPNPQSVYGQSKLAGEKLLAENLDRFYIFRTAWLYGNRGANFVKTIKRLARERAGTGEALKVVNDQVGTPTYSMELCSQIITVLRQFPQEYGIYHCTGNGRCSWFDFASHVVASYAIPVGVLPCTTRDFPRPAPRPANSVLENARLKHLGIDIMADWKSAFAEYMAEEALIADKRSDA